MNRTLLGSFAVAALLLASNARAIEVLRGMATVRFESCSDPDSSKHTQCTVHWEGESGPEELRLDSLGEAKPGFATFRGGRAGKDIQVLAIVSRDDVTVLPYLLPAAGNDLKLPAGLLACASNDAITFTRGSGTVTLTPASIRFPQQVSLQVSNSANCDNLREAILVLRGRAPTKTLFNAPTTLAVVGNDLRVTVRSTVLRDQPGLREHVGLQIEGYATAAGRWEEPCQGIACTYVLPGSWSLLRQALVRVAPELMAPTESLAGTLDATGVPLRREDYSWSTNVWAVNGSAPVFDEKLQIDATTEAQAQVLNPLARLFAASDALMCSGFAAPCARFAPSAGENAAGTITFLPDQSAGAQGRGRSRLRSADCSARERSKLGGGFLVPTRSGPSGKNPTWSEDTRQRARGGLAVRTPLKSTSGRWSARRRASSAGFPRSREQACGPACQSCSIQPSRPPFTTTVFPIREVIGPGK